MTFKLSHCRSSRQFEQEEAALRKERRRLLVAGVENGCWDKHAVGAMLDPILAVWLKVSMKISFKNLKRVLATQEMQSVSYNS